MTKCPQRTCRVCIWFVVPFPRSVKATLASGAAPLLTRPIHQARQDCHQVKQRMPGSLSLLGLQPWRAAGALPGSLLKHIACSSSKHSSNMPRR